MKDCLTCSSKSCRTLGSDCFSLKDHSLKVYEDRENNRLARSSSSLVDNGRAGRLSRFQELIEFCRIQEYGTIGLAYCFGMEALAEDVRRLMEEAGLTLIPARCSMGAVQERDIDPSKDNDVYSCNPAGQSEFLNQRADFVVEMGLCLGHDVLFHQQLKKPFTVLIVKDRVYSHNPLEGIREYASRERSGESDK